MPSFPWAKRASQQPPSSYQDDRNPTLPNLSPNDEPINYDDSPDLSSYDTDPRQASTTFDGILNPSRDRAGWLRTPSILGGKAPSIHRQQADSIAGEEYYELPAHQQTSPKSTSSSHPAPRKSFRAKLGLGFASRDNLADYANAEEGGDKPTRKKSVLRKGAPSSYRDPGGGGVAGAGASSWAVNEQEPSLPRIAGGFQGEEYDSEAMERKQDESDSLRPDAWVQSSQPQPQPQPQPQTTRMMDRPAGAYTLASSPGQGRGMEQTQQYTSLTGNRPSSRLGLKDERPASPGRGAYAEQSQSSPARQRQDPLGSPIIARQTQQPVRPNSSTPLIRGGVLSQMAQSSPIDRMSQQQPSNTASPIITRTSTLARDDAVSPSTTSAPSTNNEAAKELEVLKVKYMNVKRQYFTQKRQLESLQESLAQHNLSISRTSLDDGEYVRRLESLDLSVRDLAFSVRKHWAAIPDWLVPHVSPGAVQAAGKEMISVGRAVVSRWLWEMVFDRHFHPALPEALSLGLKQCQRALSQPSSSSSASAASADAHLTALERSTTWRLSTLDGLSSLLNPASASTSSAIAAFITTHAALLASALKSYLVDPLPPDVRIDASIASIVDAAVRIAVHIPMESREVVVEWYMPGEGFEEGVMKVEGVGLGGGVGGGSIGVGGGLRVVQAQGGGRDRAGSTATNGSTYEDAVEPDSSASAPDDEDATASGQDVGGDGTASTAGGGGFKKGMASAAAAVAASSARKSEDGGGGGVGAAGIGATTAGKKVRMCVFMSARVRGNGKGNGRVLTQAPVFVA